MLLKRALISSVEEQYRSLIEQKNFDNISAIIKLNKVFELNNNRINTAPIDIVNIIRIGNIFVIITSTPHNMQMGDGVILQNVQGLTTTTPINGTLYALTNFTLGPNVFSITTTYNAGAYVANTGQIISHQSLATQVEKIAVDYNHLLAVKAKFEQILPYGVSNITNTQPISIVLDTINNNIVSKETINVSGVLSNTNANGNFYVKKTNRKTFTLYVDKDFATATSGNGDYQGLAVIKRMFYNFAVPLISIEKISNYDDASQQIPLFERGDKQIKILPDDFVCSEITLDYISNAVIYIDVNNSVIDLTDTYPQEFLYLVISKAVQLFAGEVNSPNRYKVASAEIQNEQ